MTNTSFVYLNAANKYTLQVSLRGLFWALGKEVSLPAVFKDLNI